MNVNAVILAGGQSRRMQGKDKGLLALHGTSLVQHVLGRITPQVNEIYISANRNTASYRQFGHPVLADDTQGYLGPLAGIASAMHASTADYLLTVPCDCPFLPDDLVTRMLAQLNETDAAVCLAHDGQRLQPLIALIASSLSMPLDTAIKVGHLKAERWLCEQDYCIEEFAMDQQFMNINSPADLALAQALFEQDTPAP